MNITQYQLSLDSILTLRLQMISHIREIITNSGFRWVYTPSCQLDTHEYDSEVNVVCVDKDNVYRNMWTDGCGTSGEESKLDEAPIDVLEEILKSLVGNINSLIEWEPIVIDNGTYVTPDDDFDEENY